MKKLLVVLCLVGCSTPPRPTDGQLAMWAYWASLCGKTSDYWTIEHLLKTDAVLRGCVTSHAIKADAAYRAGREHRPNAVEASGWVLMESAKSRQQNCDSKPALGGGWTTTCY